jgi:hypothetical protein
MPEPGRAAGRFGSDPARRARLAVGALGLLLVVIASVHQLSQPRGGTPGIPAGQRLRPFVAPLATGALTGDANVRPRCNPRRPNPQALNVCGRGPTVLAFFVPGSGECVRAVDAEQAVLRRLGGRGVSFGAVAIESGRRAVARLVRTHHWTLPVAVDPDGAVAQLYGAVICPLFELAGPGGVVQRRLIGGHWSHAPALAAAVANLRRKAGAV